LGEYFHSLIRSRADLFEVLAGPAFALTVIACKPPLDTGDTKLGPLENGETFGNGLASPQLQVANELTKKVYERVNGQGEFFLTSTVIGGVYAIRIVSANTQTEQKCLTRCFDVLVEATEAEARRQQ
jgi:aromatic-L-amino-acid decarboxylase